MRRTRRLSLAGWISLLISSLPAAAEPASQAQATRCIIDAVAQSCQVVQTTDSLELNLDDGRAIAPSPGTLAQQRQWSISHHQLQCEDHPCERHGLRAADAQRNGGDHATGRCCGSKCRATSLISHSIRRLGRTWTQSGVAPSL